MSCRIVDNVHTTFLKDNIVDENRKIIESTSKYIDAIDSVNSKMRDDYGVKENLVNTMHINSFGGINKVTKVEYNHEVGAHIDGIINQTNKIYNLIKPGQEYKSSEVLHKIATTKGEPFAELARALMKHIGKNDALITIEKLDNPEHLGLYTAFNNRTGKGKIRISPGVKDRLAYQVVMHEIVHALTVDMIDNNPNSQVVKDLTMLYEDTKWLTTNKSLYGYTSVKEFAVAVLTDPKVMRDMKRMPSSGNVKGKYTNMFDQVISNILKALGINRTNKNIHDQAIEVVSSIIEQTQSTVQQTQIIFPEEYIQDQWESEQNMYDNIRSDESFFGEDPRDNLFEDDSQGLNSPFVDDFDNTFDIHDYPSSLGQWADSRKQILRTLKESYRRLRQENSKSSYLNDINTAIELIEHQLQIANNNNPLNIFSSVIDEIENLEYLINKLSGDTNTALDLMNSNDLVSRLEALNEFFLGKEAKTVSKLDSTNERSDFNKDFMNQVRDPNLNTLENNFKSLDRKGVEEIQDRISRLINNYNDHEKNILISQLKNTTSVRNALMNKNSKFTEDDLLKLIKYIEDGDLDVDIYSQKTLGIVAGGGIMGQVLGLRFDEHLKKEHAFVGRAISEMGEYWDKFKNKKDSKGKYLSDKLKQKDKFGKTMNRLVSKYTDVFHSTVAHIYHEKERFKVSDNESDYKALQESIKNNFDFIDIRRLQSVRDRYKGSNFEKHFINITDQEAQEYESKLKDRLGPIMFEKEVQRAVDSLDEYVENSLRGILTGRQQLQRDPFAYLDHMDSKHYNLKSIQQGGVFLEPDFNVFIPKINNEQFYNQSFKEIEDNSDMSEYYTRFHDLLTNHVNPILQSEGIDISLLDIQAFEDVLDRKAIEDLSFFGKLGAGLKAAKRNELTKFADATLANMEERHKDGKANRKKLHVGYSSEISQRIAKNKELFSGLSLEKLLVLAKKENIVLTANQIDSLTHKDKHGNIIKFPPFYDLAESIARSQLNNITSSNLQESIQNSAGLAADARARRSVVGMFEVFKDIAKNVDGGKGYIYNKFHSFGQTNIYGEKFSGDADNFKVNKASKFFRRKALFGYKVKSTADRITIKNLKDNIDSIKLTQDVNFRLKNEEFSIRKGSNGLNEYVKKDQKDKEHILTESQFKEEYLKYSVSRIGTQTTIGSVSLGFVNVMRQVQLGFSPRAGVKNRIAGMSQSMTSAASNRFGFGMVEYNAARRFLFGMNTVQYTSKLGWKGLSGSRRFEQVNMLEQFASNLSLTQNRVDEEAMKAKYNSGDARSMFENFDSFLMDFSMNNPERHNQLEIMVSTMMTTNVTDKNGNVFKVFDKNKGEFTIYKHGTNELKDEFNTPKNIALWTKFESYTDPNTGEEFQDSILMTNRIKAAIEQTQGNYNNSDIVMFQDNVMGKIFGVYTRYLFENTNIQWGKHKVDLRTMEMDVKGRKVNLFEHAPTAAVYLGSNYIVPVLASAVMFASLPAVSVGFLAATGLGLGLTVGLALKQGSINLDQMRSKKELALAMDFAKEVCLKLGQTPLNTFSYGRFDNTSLGKKAITATENLQAKRYDGLLTDKERLMLSECAQEVAIKFQNYTAYTIMGLLAKALFLLVAGGDDDNDDTYIQRKIKEMVNIEYVLNGILNDRNSIVADLDKFTNPKAFYESVTASAFARTVSREGGKLWKIAKGDYDDAGSLGLAALDLTFAPITNKIPNNVKKMIYGTFDKDKGIFSDNRVYEGKDALDKLASKEMKKGDDYYKADATEQRSKLRKKVEEYFKDQLKKEGGDDMSSADYQTEFKRRVNQFMSDTNKRNFNSYEDLINSEIFKDKMDELESMKDSGSDYEEQEEYNNENENMTEIN